jgi:sterol desaturase/sphingolipid hydroxylase (fatty acid hydroxylase superfamily)
MFEANKAVFTNFLYVALAFVLLEILFARKTQQPLMSFKDSFCNLITMVIGRLTQPLFAGYIYFTLTGLEKMMPFHLPQTTQTTIAAIILTDFVYYWQHRLSHTQRWLWLFHEVHHSSKYFNFTTSFRLAWLGRLVAPLFFAPLVIVGFSAEQVTLFFILNLFYQFFLHTQLVGKLPLVEGILNTPSAHRVHHARNKEYLNKNFGGIFMLWDRFYGTYEPEIASPKFGIIGRFESYNPFTVQFHKIPGYSKFAAVCARMLSSARAKAAVLAAFIIPSMAGAPTVAQTIERKPLEGKIEVSDQAFTSRQAPSP